MRAGGPCACRCVTRISPWTGTGSGRRSRRARGCIIINSPHNPSGAVLTESDLDALTDLLRSSGALVLSDEVYEHMLFDGRSHASMHTRAELAARSFVVSSFGKTFHATGWKIGYCVAPRR